MVCGLLGSGMTAGGACQHRCGGGPRPRPPPEVAGEARNACSQSPYEDSGSQRVGLKQNLNVEGWNSHVHREFPGIVESTNLSRDSLRGIGRTANP